MIRLTFDNISVEIKNSKVIQLAAIDIETTNRIFRYISEYFNGHKYLDRELKEYGNQYPVIVKDGAEISRKALNITVIGSFEDVDDVLEYKKDSVFMDYLKLKLEDNDIQEDLLKMEVLYNSIIKKIADNVKDISNIEFEEKNITSESFSAKKLKTYVDRGLSTYEKIKIIIDICGKLSDLTCERRVLYFNFVETYLEKEQWQEILEYSEKYKFQKIIFSTGKPEYLNYNNVEDINFIYQKNVAFLPEICYLQDKVNKNIELNKEISEKEMLEYLEVESFNLIKNKTNERANSHNMITKALLSQNREEAWSGSVEMVKTTII